MAVTSDLMNNIDGNNKAFEFTFPYQNIKDIKVELNRSPVEANTTGSTTFTTLDHTKFKLAPNAVTVTLSAIEAPTDFQEASGAPKAATGTGEFDYVVSGKVYRDTDSSQLTATFYPGSAIRSSDLNNNFTQNLFVTQESEKEVEDNKTAVDRLVGFTTDNGATWVTTGGNTNASTDPKGLRYGINTADEARSIAATAEQTADAAVQTADDVEATVETYVADSTGLKGDGVSPNPKGVAYAVNQVETYVADSTGLKGDGQGGNPQGVKYAVDEAVAAVASAAQANLTAGNAVTSAANANTTAGNAVTSATNANTTAANAVASAATANTTAGNAVTTANDAETKADTAIATANTASTTAGNAVTTANAASTKADDVEDTVELYVADSNGLRGDGTDPVTDPQGVAYAVRLASEASASVAASAIYKVVADLATLATNYPLTGNQPSPPGPDPNNLEPTPDGTYVQITDSTGISLANNVWTSTNSGATFSSTSGFPSGFDGHSQLTLRVKVSNSTAGSESYVAQEYYANDPESRYGEDRKIIVEHDQVIDANYTIQLDKNAHSVSGGLVFNNSTNKYDGPVTIAHNGTDLLYNPENHAQPYVATNAATAGNTVTIPVNSTWLIS